MGSTAKYRTAILALTLVLAGAACRAQDDGTTEVAEALPPVSASPTTEPSTATTIPPTTAPPTTLPLAVELPDAVGRGLVSVESTGAGLEYVLLTVTSTTEQSLALSIAPGTVFASGSRSVQSMVARRGEELFLDPGEQVTVDVPAACINMHLATPEASNSFTVRAGSPGDLTTLVTSAQFAEVDFVLQQFAIWTITDNPGRNGYVGIGTGGDGSPPTADDLRAIRDLFTTVGVPPARYRALR